MRSHRPARIIACLAVASLFGCGGGDFSNGTTACDAIYPPATVSTVLATQDRLECGSISVFGYLRMNANVSGQPSYYLVPDSEYMASGLSDEAVSFLGLRLDFSMSESSGLPSDQCIGRFVVADAEIETLRGRPVLLMDDSAALTIIGDHVRQACRL